jgi:uncharacterized membrane protein
MSRRTLYVLLFVSVAINLFVLGAVAGILGAGTHLHMRHAGGPRFGGPMAAAARSLPPDRAAAFRELVRAQAAAVGPKMRQARDLRRSAFLRLGAEPVDTAAIFRDLDAARLEQIQAQDAVDHRIVTFAAQLPRDQRARFAAALARPARGPRPGGPRPE